MAKSVDVTVDVTQHILLSMRCAKMLLSGNASRSAMKPRHLIHFSIANALTNPRFLRCSALHSVVRVMHVNKIDSVKQVSDVQKKFVTHQSLIRDQTQ